LENGGDEDSKCEIENGPNKRLPDIEITN